MSDVSIPTLGTIVTWGAPPSITISNLRAALSSAGLDPNIAKDLLPRNAFSRAARELEEGRIIRKVTEEGDLIRFQFTREEADSTEIRYSKEAIVTLDKTTGIVTCMDPVLQQSAQDELDRQMGHRKSADVTRLVQKVFDQHKGDLVPLRQNGGVYFVPDTHKALVEQVWHFLLGIGGTMSRFTINAGDAATSGSVADSLVEHFSGMITDLHQQIGEVGVDSSDEAIKRRFDQISLLRAKLGSYSYLLQDTAEQIEKGIKLAEYEYNNRLGLPNEWEPGPEDVPDLDAVMGGK